jgi:hypothetical protein
VIAIVTVVRRAMQKEDLLGLRDARWLWRRAALATAAALGLQIVAAAVIAVASLFVTVPDI